MIGYLALALLVAVLGLVLPGLITRDDDLGFELHELEPPVVVMIATIVRFYGYTPAEWDRPGTDVLVELHDLGPELRCGHCGQWLWTEEGAAFHLMLWHLREEVWT